MPSAMMKRAFMHAKSRYNKFLPSSIRCISSHSSSSSSTPSFSTSFPSISQTHLTNVRILGNHTTINSLASLHHCRRNFATHQVVVKPIAESISEGQVAEILKKVGDAVAVEEVIAILETDKVSVDIRSDVAGVVSKIHTAVGDTIQVGAPIASIDIDGKVPVTAAAPVVPKESSPAVPAAVPVVDPHGSHHVHPTNHRVSIHFTHGRSNAPAPVAAALSSSSAPSPPSSVPASSAPRVAGKQGNQLWAPTVVYMDVNFIGNPFGHKAFTLDETAIQMIELGGAMPDVPKPTKDTKKKK